MGKLSSIPTSKLYRAQFVATARLQLWFTAETHKLFINFAQEAARTFAYFAGKDSTLDTVGGFRAQQSLLGKWGDTLKEYITLLQGARKAAATFPFGGLCEFHQRLITTELTESTEFTEAVKGGVFDPQIQILVDAAAEHLYGDGLNLSGRIWRMDRQARDGMNTLISKAIADGTSAWDLAKQLEQFLGADADCPRWTSTRLYKRTKAEIAAGDMTGLLTGPNCDGQGVAYNALRLARTEIQKAHALATDKVLMNSPWVEKEKVNLSAQHPEPDECDDVTSGGENGQGIYPKGEIELPLHPNCLCYKTAVMMDEDEFTRQLRGWMKGEEWEEMDQYAKLLDVRSDQVGSTDLSKDASLIMLGVWLFGEALTL